MTQIIVGLAIITRSPPIGGVKQNAAPLNLKISADIMRVIDLGSNRGGGELFGSLQVGPVLRTVMQYSITVCSLPEAPSDVVSVGLDVRVKWGKIRSNRT